MKTQLTPEQHKKRIQTFVKVGGLALAGILFAPVAIMAIGGLVGIAVTGVLALTIIYATPVVAMKLANWRLKALKAEATKNPVESLQMQYVKKEEALNQFKENIKMFGAQVLSFADQVKQYVKEGLDDAPNYVAQLEKMKRLNDLRNQKYVEAKQTLADFAESIQRTDRKWKMACAAAKMNEAAGDMEGDVFDKICIETALDSVQTKLNEAFADLEISLLDDDKEKAKKMFEDKRRTELVQPTVTAEPLNVNNNRQKIAVS